MPGRYAKREVSSGFLPAIDVYAYRAPSADVGVRAAQAAPETPAVPQEKPSSDAPTDPSEIRQAVVETGNVVL